MKANKGNVMVVLDKDIYFNKMINMLNESIYIYD